MAARPDQVLEWATNTVDEVVEINGQQVFVTNKTEPPQAFKNTGILARQKVGRARINWVLNLICQWIAHLDGRYDVGDIHISNINHNLTELSERLGGTWVLTGTQSVGGTTLYYYNKTE